MKPYRNCLVCGKEFWKKENCSIKEWIKRSKFCCKPCADTYRQGRPMKHSAQFKKGQFPWNKGLPGLKEENNPTWKGDNVGYHGLHKWVQSKLGKPSQCEHCFKIVLNPYQIHWANKSHKYKRDLTDWLRLCASCHLVYDRS